MSSKIKNSEAKKPIFSSAETRKQIVQLVIVLLLAIAIRVIYLMQYKAHAPFYSVMMVDSQYYDLWAQRVAAGKGYGPKPFYMAPLYPYVLAIIYRLFGHNFDIVYIFQACLGVLNLLLVYLIGRLTFGHFTGLVSTILLTLYAPIVYLESKVLTETLSLTLNLLSILALIYASSRPSVLRYLGAGVLLGLGVLCRPNVIIFVVLVIVWLWFGFRGREGCRERLRNIVLIAAGVVVTIMPVTVRNYVVGKDIVLISSNAGINFAQGNLGTKLNERSGIFVTLEGFSGSAMTQEQEEHAIAESELGHPVKASESSSFWFKKTVAYIIEHPGTFLVLEGKKVLWSLHNGEAPCNCNIYLERTLVPVLRYLALPFCFLLSLSVYGFVCSLRSRIDGRASLLCFYILSVFATLLIFSVSSRFRSPMVPALSIFASFGVESALKEARKRNIGSLLILFVCILLFLGISAIRYPIPMMTAGGYNNLGLAYATRGQIDEAIKQYKRALELQPTHFFAHSNLGDALVAKGKLDEAAIHYQQAIIALPNNPKPYFKLGTLYGEKGQIDDEILQYRKAISLKPDFGEAHNNLAVALYYKGKYAEAWKEVRLARKYGIKPSPDFLKALSKKMPEP